MTLASLAMLAVICLFISQASRVRRCIAVGTDSLLGLYFEDISSAGGDVPHARSMYTLGLAGGSEGARDAAGVFSGPDDDLDGVSSCKGAIDTLGAGNGPHLRSENDFGRMGGVAAWLAGLGAAEIAGAASDRLDFAEELVRVGGLRWDSCADAGRLKGFLANDDG